MHFYNLDLVGDYLLVGLCCVLIACCFLFCLLSLFGWGCYLVRIWLLLISLFVRLVLVVFVLRAGLCSSCFVVRLLAVAYV